MRRLLLFFLIQTIITGTTKGQDEKSDLKELAKQIEQALASDALQNESFGPIKIVKCNMMVFRAGNNLATTTIKSLQLSKKFPSNDSLFKWLIPHVNKIALTNYFLETSFSKGKYDTLFGKLNTSFCPCINIASKSKDVSADNNFINCVKKYLNDSVVIKEYIQTFLSLPSDNKQNFLSDLLGYANLHCDEMFNKMIVLAKEEIPDYFNKSMVHYNGTLLEGFAWYSFYAKKDSMEMIFPAYMQYQKEVTALKKLYKQSGNKLLYAIENLITNDMFERKSILITDSDTSKVRLLAQFVFEVGLDKAIPYIKNIKYYPRESIQNIEFFEKEIERAKRRQN